MSGADARTDYGTIVVIGGGCYGSYYVRQLERARAAGALRWDRVLVVDRDPRCRVGRESTHGATVTVVVADWRAFLDDHLGAAAARARDADRRDAIVPSPLMPHLLFEWLMTRARARWPERAIEQVPLPLAPATPWERAAPDGSHYASYATWMCPINCIEPRRCPHTRAERTWTMPDAAHALVASAHTAGRRLEGPIIFHCTHRAYGVGMIDTRSVIDGDAFVREAGTRGAAVVLVGTVSHCHGALSCFTIGSERADGAGDRTAAAPDRPDFGRADGDAERGQEAQSGEQV